MTVCHVYEAGWQCYTPLTVSYLFFDNLTYCNLLQIEFVGMEVLCVFSSSPRWSWQWQRHPVCPCGVRVQLCPPLHWQSVTRWGRERLPSREGVGGDNETGETCAIGELFEWIIILIPNIRRILRWYYCILWKSIYSFKDKMWCVSAVGLPVGNRSGIAVHSPVDLM